MTDALDFDELVEPFEAALVATARALEAAEPVPGGEKGLEVLIERELLHRAGDESWAGVARQRTIVDQAWPGVGPVDLTLESGSGALPVLIELKWDELAACSWDMAKLALCCANDHASHGVLVAVASTANWRSKAGAELFDHRSWRVDVLLERFADSFRSWAQEVKTRPARLPATWMVSDVLQVPFRYQTEPFELRAVVIQSDEPASQRISYYPVAPGVQEALALRPSRSARVEPVQGKAGEAIASFAQEAPIDRTVAAAEGGTFDAVDVVGLVANEIAFEDETTESAAYWFASPAERRLYLEQRGLRAPRSRTPDFFTFSSGSGLGPGVDIGWNGQQLVATRRSSHGLVAHDLVTPTEVQWRRFWRALDLLDVWSWSPSYEIEDMVTDGHGWSVDIGFVGRRCRSEGYVAYPDGDDEGSATWAAFELALEELISLPLYDSETY